MHFSIPDTSDLKDPRTTAFFVAYNVHVNGSFHCSVRYKQLYNFHEQIKKTFGQAGLPFFPPKKILPLVIPQVEERRSQLEKYIQLVSQDPRIVNTEFFNGFLLNAQLESSGSLSEEVTLDVYLMNWEPIALEVMTSDRSCTVLESLARRLNFTNKLLSHFSLFMARRDDIRCSLVRRLQDFESPFLSLKTANQNRLQNSYYLVVRKSYWDPIYDEDLLDEPEALDILYQQVIADVELGWTEGGKQVARQLIALQSRRAAKEYIKLARTLKYYGYIQFEQCVCDYPQPNSRVTIAAGGKELILKSHSAEQETEFSFRVTRVRCWRLTTCPPNGDRNSDGSSANDENNRSNDAMGRFQLSFEYLQNKDILKWICITSDQAILISMCLKGMVDELLMKRNGQTLSDAPGANGLSEGRGRRGSWSYMKRDGSSFQFAMPRSVSTEMVANQTKVTHKAVKANKSTRNGHSSKQQSFTRANDAFDGIGDDDL